MSRFGEEKLSDRIYGEQETVLPGHAAAEGMAGEREFVAEANENAKLEKAAQLRSEIAQTQKGIEEITASIEKVVANIQAGEKIVKEQGGNEVLASIHAKLGEEAQAQKLILLAEKAKLETSLQGFEDQLESL